MKRVMRLAFIALLSLSTMAYASGGKRKAKPEAKQACTTSCPKAKCEKAGCTNAQSCSHMSCNRS